MRAMLLEALGQPLVLRELPEPQPGPGELRVRVSACGVCRADLHVVDGELPAVTPPVIPGHEIVGRVDALGPGVEGFALGQRVGIPWLGHTCGQCWYCRHAAENLCDAPQFTGYTRPGGYAERVVAGARFAFTLGEAGDDVALAPLLCAGLIGWRSLVKAGDARRLGLYGFGAAAHIVMQVARWQGRAVYAFSRPGDVATQDFARALGAVCAGIHMSDIPSFPYTILWGEREVVSVANLTRQDGLDFFAIAAQAGIRTETHRYALEDANRALDDLRHGRFQGAAVLVP